MLKVASDLVKFEIDGGLALMNGRFPRPLIFKKGIELVNRALSNPDSVIDPKLKDLLIRFKILVEGEESPPQTHQVFHTDGKKEYGLYMLVTQRCNLGCSYCLGRDTSYINDVDMSWNIAQLSIKKAGETIEGSGTLQLIYFGGEPMLNWELIKKCLSYSETAFKKSSTIKIKHHITTNLTRLPPDFIDLSKQYGMTLLVDLDGNSSTHNNMRPFRNGKPSYDKITKNLAKIGDSGIYYEIRATITSENVNELRDIQSHHNTFKPQACAFPTLTPVDCAGDPLDPSMYPDPNVYKKKLCDAANDGFFDLSSLAPTNVIAARMLRGEFVTYGCGMLLGNTGVVTHDGTVYPCIYFVGQDPMILGNINDADNPFSQSVYKQFFEKWENAVHVDNMQKCKECPIRYLCGGGCPVRTMSIQGTEDKDIKAKNYFRDISCATSWAAIESTIEHYRKKA